MKDNINTEKSQDVALDAMVDLLVQNAAKSKEPLYNDTFLSEELLKAFQLNKAHKYFIDTQLLNEVKDLDTYLSHMNKDLNNEKLFIGFVQTLNDWRKSKTILKIPILGMSYRIYTFLTKRVIPRLKFYRKIGLRRKYHFISKAETIGRLIYNGFEIQTFIELNDRHVFIIKKSRNTKNYQTKFWSSF